MLPPRQVARLEGRRATLLAELHRAPNLMRGDRLRAPAEVRAARRRLCAWGPRHPGLQVNVTVGGKTRTGYVRHGERAMVEAWVAVYHRLWQVVAELTEVNLALLNATPARRPPR